MFARALFAFSSSSPSLMRGWSARCSRARCSRATCAVCGVLGDRAPCLLSPHSSPSLMRGSSARCLRARFLFFLVEVTSVFWTLGACCVRTVLGGYLLNGFDDDTYSGITVDTQHLDYQTIALSKVLTCYVHVPPLNPPSPLMGRPGVYDLQFSSAPIKKVRRVRS